MKLWADWNKIYRQSLHESNGSQGFITIHTTAKYAYAITEFSHAKLHR
jgi:hypothetical protein